MKVTEDKQKQYEKALRIVKAYPEAFKIVEEFEKGIKFKFDDTHINLCAILSVRACNIVKQYFQENRLFTKKDLPLTDWNFPVKYLSKIDTDKLLMVRNCGKGTHKEILLVIERYTK